MKDIQVWAVGWSQLRRKEVENFAMQQLDSVVRSARWCTVLLKAKIVIRIY